MLVLSSLAGSVGAAGACAQKAFSSQLLLLHEGEHIWSGFPAQDTTTKQQGPGSQRQPRPSLAYGDQRARGEKGKPCFDEKRGIGAVVCSPRRVYLSRMQLSEPRLEPWVRWGLGAGFHRRLREDCWGLHPEGIFLTTPFSPPRITGLEWI